MNTQNCVEFEDGSDYDVRFTKFIGLGKVLVPSDGGGTIQDCAFLLNDRGVDYQGCSNHTIQNCLFMGNNMGVRDYNGTGGEVVNCTFDQNIYGVSYEGTSLTVKNCLFHTNSATGGAWAGIRIYNGQVSNLTEKNNAFYDNNHDIYDVTNTPYQSVDLHHTDYAYPANPPAVLLYADPYDSLWVDFDDRFRLDPGGQCVDGGDDPGYEGMPFYTTALTNRCDVPPVAIGYHYPGVVRFVDASKTGGDGLSWGSAYQYLQDALDEGASAINTGICVKTGTYYPDEDQDEGHANNQRAETFALTDGLALYGGFAGGENPFDFDMSTRNFVTNETNLSGDIDGDGRIDYNSYHVVKASGNTILDGFLITEGYANGPDQWTISGAGIYAWGNAIFVSNCTIKENRSNAGNYPIGGGAGVYAYAGYQTFTNCNFEDNTCWNISYGEGGGGIMCNASSITLIDCVFLNNQCTRKAGGLYLNDKAKAATLINCTFDNNYGASASASAVHMYTDKHSYETHEFTDCRFINNRVSGATQATVFIYNDSAIFTGCTFTDNLATPIRLSNYDVQEDTTITDCVFSGSATTRGGGIWHQGGPGADLVVSNCLFFDNTASFEGGAIKTAAWSTIINCTFTGNSAGTEGNGIWTNNDLTLTNSILWGNNGGSESDQIYIDTGDYSINYCCIQGLTGNLGGIGNIGGYPEFVDENNDNYRLNSNSPCIDEGDNNACEEPYDLDGNARKIDGNGDQEIDIDMGPYEYQGP